MTPRVLGRDVCDPKVAEVDVLLIAAASMSLRPKEELLDSSVAGALSE